MKGPLFLALEANEFRDQQLNSSRIADLETEYNILLDERGIKKIDPTPGRQLFDEVLSLAVLCWFTWPGKRPKYQQELRTFLEEFEGIADRSGLQRAFRRSITQEFKTAKTFTDLTLSGINVIFNRNSLGNFI
jgi:hypothetical protein